MLKRKKNTKLIKTKPNTDTFISTEAKITGDIKFSGHLYIYGTITGNIIAEDTTKAVLTIGREGRIEGDIHTPHINIHGQIIGNVYAGERVDIAASAVISGHVYYNLIQIDRGAKINGNLVNKLEQQVFLPNQADNTILAELTDEEDVTAVTLEG